ncbi:WD40/YVTN/BNR-like repeat-containing protein [Hymenobacter cavernae]|uniref:Photosynthesis system II assembly factor Ycf48/Hcf136-like domain-containing protein n=1 Tax=Hymenobacter cavernae TaxID=2044852 RepID=A0ABQ1UPK5_9BACT|nr:YCF48-related protein [Hymenobacter cavernae]GGF22037.1 hypothetical protein GCM10011383_37080 [Hymenobacter cavernae]
MRFEDLAVPASIRPQTLATVDFISATQGFVGGAQGIILATTDGGQSWQDRSQKVLGDVNKLLFTSATNGWAGTSTGLYRTIDGGVSWKRQEYLPVEDIQLVTAKVGYAVGPDNTILRTNDGGASWSSQNAYNWYPRLDLHAVSFTSADSGVAVGSEYAIYKTTNGGLNWDRNSLGGFPNMYDVVRYRNGKGFVWVGGAKNTGIEGGGFQEVFPVPGSTTTSNWTIYRVHPSNTFTIRGLAQWQDNIVAVGDWSIIRKHKEYSKYDSPWVQVLGPDGTTIRHNYRAADFSDASTFFAVGDSGTVSRFHYN